MADKLSFGWERLEFLLKEPNIRDLLTSYWEELSPLNGLPLDIDWARLLRHEAEGIYRIWAARVNGTLAGFAAFYVQPHMYHRSVLAAVDAGQRQFAPRRMRKPLIFRKTYFGTRLAEILRNGARSRAGQDSSSRH